MSIKDLPSQLIELSNRDGVTYLWQEEAFGKNTQIELPAHQTIYHLRINLHPLQKKETLKVKLNEKTQYHYFEIQQTEGLSHLEIQLSGEFSQAQLLGLIDLKDKQKSEWEWEVRHLVPNTSSEQYVKSIIQDEGAVDFAGKIFIAPHAQKSDAKQLNKNLLLSKKAKCLSRPELEIFANDVKCGHGLTTSQFRDDELFYLQTRGIKKDTAKNFLAKAFIQDILSKLPPIYAAKLKQFKW
ncbi:MAG: SufD family Fe-S cluster assembly protein [Bacteriovoracaceae bacterium]|nr:SufD family Fe-S cluster assembly protein [Bacteriovoracaceae bacterium]